MWGHHQYQRAHAGVIITPKESRLETFTQSKISEDIFSYCLCQDYGLASLFPRVRQEHPRHPLCISCCLDVSPLREHILCEAFCIEGKPAAPRDRRKLLAFLWPPRGWWSKLELFPLKWKQRRRPCDYSSVSQTPLAEEGCLPFACTFLCRAKLPLLQFYLLVSCSLSHPQLFFHGSWKSYSII